MLPPSRRSRPPSTSVPALAEPGDRHTRTPHYGGDFSIFLGMGVGGLVYLVAGLGARCARRPTPSRSCCGTSTSWRPPEPPSVPQPQSSTRPPSPSGWNSGMAPECADQGRVLAERLLPPATLGHQSADDDGLGVHAAHQAERRGQRGASRDHVVDHGHPPAPHRHHTRRVHAEPLGLVGRDGVHRLGPRLAQVDLRRLVQDHVVVETEGPAGLDGQGDPHGGDGHHDLGLAPGASARPARARRSRRRRRPCRRR